MRNTAVTQGAARAVNTWGPQTVVAEAGTYSERHEGFHRVSGRFEPQ